MPIASVRRSIWSAQVTYNTDCCGLSFNTARLDSDNDGCCESPLPSQTSGIWNACESKDRMF